jgi:tRNA U34 5-methylaminomethyl-2-thiouridine-forming methyltransferase MnmC
MWSEEILKKMFTFLKKNGFLVTYCAKGIIKRKLKEVGFKVISLPGPIGKREMTMAMKI